MKLFQIITLIFCLGIFLVPKDNFYAQNRQETCCKNDSEMSCCKKDHQHQQHSKENHGKQGKKSSCNDDCCSTCVTCYNYIETPYAKNPQAEIPYYQSDKNLPFEYSDPYLSGRLKEIWQPPKIG
ncbi:hypothetical protein FY557_15575 [Chryseobacterium sp. SN22]|uniref:hypothetical protein n=1 Tax=Chryseobacterium sp. SN22 TaxID=2606431 RepID=UPI0011EE47F2|nr:hypothetical protein [Chryseobacterium sp. SN22]KAA0126850.1 hypothetical protein FY557_15575 [Chryseobacterium sp. SN22]